MPGWDDLYSYCGHCKKCRLHGTRNNVVIGDGNREARIMFIGEGPGEEEDRRGLPFVGKAGQLLDKMLGAVSLTRSDVYIGNIVKCRPPGNRNPFDDEIDACIDFLRYQVYLVKPEIIVCLGSISARAILDPEFRITRQRGVWYERKGCKIVATYHPAALLRDEHKKGEAWEDMQSIRKKFDLLPSTDLG